MVTPIFNILSPQINELYTFMLEIYTAVDDVSFIVLEVIRKKFQSFLYRFHSYDRWNIIKRTFFKICYSSEFYRLKKYIIIYNRNYVKICVPIIKYSMWSYWWFFSWSSWVLLTYILYYNSKVRDLGPSFDIYDYNPDDDMGLYLTIGPFLLVSWVFWTLSVNFTINTFFFYNLYKGFYIICAWFDWYLLTIYSCIENARVYNVRLLYNDFYFSKLYIYDSAKFSD